MSIENEDFNFNFSIPAYAAFDRIYSNMTPLTEEEESTLQMFAKLHSDNLLTAIKDTVVLDHDIFESDENPFRSFTFDVGSIIRGMITNNRWFVWEEESAYGVKLFVWAPRIYTDPNYPAISDLEFEELTDEKDANRYLAHYVEAQITDFQSPTGFMYWLQKTAVATATEA